MAKKCGRMSVHVLDPKTGKEKWFHEGDEFPGWAEKLIDNPLAFEGGEEKVAKEAEADEDEGDDGDYTSPPPQAGAGSGKGEWFNYANRHNVPVDHEMTRDELIEACDRAGIAT